jgi:hypothetical protein
MLQEEGAMTKSKTGKPGKQKPASKRPAAGEPQEGSQQSGTAAGSSMGGRQGGVDAGDEAEVQQSAQREGMGSHRHGGRGNEQAIDAAADVDDLGNRIRGAANSRETGNKS